MTGYQSGDHVWRTNGAYGEMAVLEQRDTFVRCRDRFGYVHLFVADDLQREESE